MGSNTFARGRGRVTDQDKHQDTVEVTEVHNPADGHHEQQQVEPAASQQTPQGFGIRLAWNPACTTLETQLTALS